ncbi:MAG: hypothetical protein M1434_12515 [Chloroflexi bacterium]|nr:hypothetical protein [Chloroflexota bacterium]MCL5275547.1 hypothetical protein [Chloroflexota bacterium]
MDIIPQLITRYSVVLYAVCGIACAYFFFTGVASLRELRRAVFQLERRAVVSRAINAMLKAALCMVIGVAIYAVTTIAPVTRANSLLDSPTNTPSGIIIPTSMPTAVINTSGQALNNLVFTPTITFEGASGVSTTAVTGGANPQATTAPADLVSDCSDANAQIINPTQGERVSGNVIVSGTAVLGAGDWYKLEIQPPGSSQWALLGRGQTTVIASKLQANFSTASLAPGVYPFRLQIVGADGGIRATCRVPIKIGS